MHTKICGLRCPDDLAIVEDEGVDFCGLWTGIEHHKNNLDDQKFIALAGLCQRIEPVAVCVKKPIDDLIALLRRTRVRMVQLHGFNQPKDVLRLKAAGFTVIKTLHLPEDGNCLEARWLPTYEAAGCDIFLLDHFAGPERIGSNGTGLSEPVIAAWRHRLGGRRLWLAGGLNAGRISSFTETTGFEAVDIDSGARREGEICREAVRSIVTAARVAQESRNIA